MARVEIENLRDMIRQARKLQENPKITNKEFLWLSSRVFALQSRIRKIELVLATREDRRKKA